MKKPTKTAQELLNMKKQSGFIAIGLESTVLDALRVLADRDIGAVLITEEKDRLVGIFSERDYARKGELQNRTAATTPVRDVMTAKVVSVSPDQTVEVCRKIMGEKRVRHLPVTSAGRVIGVLSSKDILDEIIAEDEKVIKELEMDQLRLTTDTGTY
jgi:CBS domain-containing protein